MPVKETELTLESLCDIDNGAYAELVNSHLRTIFRDMQNRPGHKGKRSVTMQITAVPVMDDKGNFIKAQFQLIAKPALPKWESPCFEGHVTRDGLMFNQDFPEQLDQIPLPFKDEPPPAGPPGPY